MPEPDETYRGPDAAAPGEPRPASVAPDDLHAELADLRRRVEQNDEEIDAIQITAARGRGIPWYREPAVMISVLSLALAFGTTVFSSLRLDEDRRHEARRELSGFIERLANIPRQQAEILADHPGTEGSNLVAQLNTELFSVANQARIVIRSIPGEVSTVEYMAVGFAYQTLGSLDDADELYQQAFVRATNPAERIYALRSLAAVRFLERDFEAAYELLRRALAMHAEDRDTAAIIIANDDASTLLFWASYEMVAGNCAAAAERLAEAERIVAAEPGVNLRQNIEALRASLGTCVPRVTPAPPSPQPT